VGQFGTSGAPTIRMTALVGPTYSAVMAKQLVTLVIGSSAAVDDAKSEVERVLGAALTPRDSS
jgi:hypothetical protein